MPRLLSPSLSCAAVFAAHIVPIALAVNQGSLRVDFDGTTKELQVVALSEAGHLFSTSGRALTLKWGDQIRGFLAEKPMDEMPADNYYNFSLLNKELSYDIDLSSVGCSCNAALFFVSMPGHNPDGTLAPGEFNPWYCDANNVGGVWCWEHDTIEGNKHNMAVTPHRCNAAPGEYISSCDKIGCQSNTFDIDPKGLCPDASCKIDTRRPFRLASRYEADPTMTQLVRISNLLSQGNNTMQFDSCDDTNYLAQMSSIFSGNMTMVFQLWGTDYDTMTWLDGQTGCSGQCVAEETEATFSNIAVKSLGRGHTQAAVVAPVASMVV